LFTLTSKGPERSSVRVPGEKIFSSPPRTPDGSSQASYDNTPPPLCSEKEVRTLEGVLYRRHPDEYPPYFPPVACRKKKISKRCPIRMKTLRQTRSSWSHIFLSNCLGQSSLLPHTRFQGKRTPSI